VPPHLIKGNDIYSSSTPVGCIVDYLLMFYFFSLCETQKENLFVYTQIFFHSAFVCLTQKNTLFCPFLSLNAQLRSDSLTYFSSKKTTNIHVWINIEGEKKNEQSIYKIHVQKTNMTEIQHPASDLRDAIMDAGIKSFLSSFSTPRDTGNLK